MRGPNWTDPTRGVTGETLVTSTPNYETYRDGDGQLRTRILPREEESNSA